MYTRNSEVILSKNCIKDVDTFNYYYIYIVQKTYTLIYVIMMLAKLLN